MLEKVEMEGYCNRIMKGSIYLWNSLTSGSQQQRLLSKNRCLLFINNRPVEFPARLKKMVLGLYKSYNKNAKVMVVVILELDGAVDFNVYDKRGFYRQGWDSIEEDVEKAIGQYLEEKVKPKIKNIGDSGKCGYRQTDYKLVNRITYH